ncbi:Uncharacterized protein FWK35_00019743 [Aphis craccivora]|uniref:RING-type domain-containing protein n=1 Tax=Aphis craccivora TaxID=307492 RepID=A0A6G0Y403_APHCR|nr:Uncharacterized protein FWK35_00019743 [Aphis craccivora]
MQHVSNVTAEPCQHMFCRRCIERWMEEGNARCPLCRTPIICLQKYCYLTRYLFVIIMFFNYFVFFQ